MWQVIIPVVLYGAYKALSGDDDSSSSDDSSYRREEALRQERESHNQKIKQEIATYVNGEVSKIEGSIKVMEKRHNTRLKWRWDPVSLGHGGEAIGAVAGDPFGAVAGGILGAVARALAGDLAGGPLGAVAGATTIGAGGTIGATIASKVAATIGQTTDQALLRLSELDTSLLEEENEHLKAKIKRLEEFKNAIQ